MNIILKILVLDIYYFSEILINNFQYYILKTYIKRLLMQQIFYPNIINYNNLLIFVVIEY